jgi:hypothetical protein
MKMGEPELLEAVDRAIQNRMAAIKQAAEAGEPPIATLIPDLDGLVIEAFYWRAAERIIAMALAPDFQKAGRKAVPITLHPRAFYYERIS